MTLQWLPAAGVVSVGGDRLTANLHQLDGAIDYQVAAPALGGGARVRFAAGYGATLFRAQDQSPAQISNDVWQRVWLGAGLALPLGERLRLSVLASGAPLVLLSEQRLHSGSSARGFGLSGELSLAARLGARLQAELLAGVQWLRAQPEGPSDRPGYLVQPIDSVRLLAVPLRLGVSAQF